MALADGDGYALEVTIARRGTLRGKLVELDERLPLADGTSLRLVIEAADDDAVIAPEAQRALFLEWAASNRQGPLEDDDDGW